MKKIMRIIMAAVLTLTIGCALWGCDNEGEELLNTYLTNLDAYEVSTQEFGEPASYIHMDECIAAAILYPETGIDSLDQAIAAWAEETAEEYKEIALEGNTAENRAELTVSYESFYAGEEKAGVKLTGTFISPTLAHPVDLVKTFNVDLETEELIPIDAILTKDGKTALFHMLTVQTGVEEEDLDAHVFDCGVLTDKGIEIVLNRGEYLPMSEGTKLAFFAYEDIKHMLTEDFDYTRERKEEDKNEDAVEDVFCTDGNQGH